MRHQHQLLLLPSLPPSWGGGAASAVWIDKTCPAQTRNTCGPSHGRQGADQGHGCISDLVAYRIYLCGPALSLFLVKAELPLWKKRTS